MKGGADGMKRHLGRILGALVFLAVILAPMDPGILPLNAKYVAAVTLLMIIWWVTEAIPIPATALLPLALFPVLGVLSPAEAAAPYADKIIFLFMGGFIIAMSMQRWGLHRRIALNIIRVVGTAPRRLVFGFMVATAFLSMWISNTATAMMMVPIAIAIISTVLPDTGMSLDEMSEEHRNFSECLIISIAHAATIGGIATIIGTPPNGLFIAQMGILFPAAPPIDFFTWMKFGVPLAALFLPVSWFWLTYGAFRHMPREISGGKEIIDKGLADLGGMSDGERWTLLVFTLTALAWIFASTKHIGDFVLPGIDMFIPGIHDSTIAISGALILFLIPVDADGGTCVMTWEYAKKIPWGILILFGGGICISVAFLKSGLAQVIAGQITVIHWLPIMVTVLVVGVVISLMTEVTSNTAMASVMIPIMAAASVCMGLHPYLLMLTVAICSSFAFMLPVATPPNAIVYGSGYISIQDMIRSGWVLNFIGVALWTVLLFTLVTWALGFTPEMPVWAFQSGMLP